MISLISSTGSQALFAKKVDIDSSHLSQIKNPNNPKNLGEKLARKIERALNLPVGWMDQLHDQENQERTPDIKELISVATDTYMETLIAIQKAQDKGILEDSDKEMLKIIAEKYRGRL